MNCLVQVEKQIYVRLIFAHAASYQNPQGAQNENDPNNTTVGTLLFFLCHVILCAFSNFLIGYNADFCGEFGF